MRMIILIFVLVVSVVLVFPYFTGQGLLYWQSKTTQFGRTALVCRYVVGLSTFETVHRYEQWAYPNRICDVLVPTQV